MNTRRAIAQWCQENTRYDFPGNFPGVSEDAYLLLRILFYLNVEASGEKSVSVYVGGIYDAYSQLKSANTYVTELMRKRDAMQFNYWICMCWLNWSYYKIQYKMHMVGDEYASGNALIVRKKTKTDNQLKLF